MTQFKQHQYFYCRNKYFEIKVTLLAGVFDRDEQAKLKGSIHSDLIFFENESLNRLASTVMDSYKEIKELEFAPIEGDEFGVVFERGE